MCLSVHRAARALARRYDDALRPARLTNGQLSLLMSLNRAEAPSIGSVATLLVMDRTTLTANLKPLVRRSFMLERELWFRPGLERFEDFLFHVECGLHGGRMALLNCTGPQF